MKILGVSLLVLVLLLGEGLLGTHPIAFVTLLQKAIHCEFPDWEPNSFEPLKQQGETMKSNGVLWINDIKYEEQYPNK